MGKIIPWLVTLVGVLLILPLVSLELGLVGSWLTALAVLVIGILMIVRAYKSNPMAPVAKPLKK